MVTVWVGGTEEAEPKKYTIHKKLICHHSTYFDTAFNGSFKEAKENEIKLSEDTSETFDVFVHWLYSAHLPSEEGSSEASDLSLYYLRLFIIADKYLIPQLQAESYRKIRWYFGTSYFPRKTFVYELFTSSLATTKLHEYFIKLCAYFIVNDRTYPDHWQGLLNTDEYFAAEVAKDMSRRLHGSEVGYYGPHPFKESQYVSYHESAVVDTEDEDSSPSRESSSRKRRRRDSKRSRWD